MFSLFIIYRNIDIKVLFICKINIRYEGLVKI